MARIELPNDQWADIIDIDPDTFSTADRNALVRKARRDGADTLDGSVYIVAAMISAWSFDVEPTFDSVNALPIRTFDPLMTVAVGTFNNLFVDVSPSPDPKAVTSPTADSSGS